MGNQISEIEHITVPITEQKLGTTQRSNDCADLIADVGN